MSLCLRHFATRFIVLSFCSKIEVFDTIAFEFHLLLEWREPSEVLDSNFIALNEDRILIIFVLLASGDFSIAFVDVRNRSYRKHHIYLHEKEFTGGSISILNSEIENGSLNVLLIIGDTKFFLSLPFGSLLNIEQQLDAGLIRQSMNWQKLIVKLPVDTPVRNFKPRAVEIQKLYTVSAKLNAVVAKFKCKYFLFKQLRHTRIFPLQ